MGISAAQRITALEIIQKIAYSGSLAIYTENYNLLLSTSSKSVIEYFNANWHTIKDDWVMGLKFSCGNFMNNTNNRLESLNGKLKVVITRYSSLEEFLDKFYVVISSLRNERDHKAALEVYNTNWN